MTKQTYENYYKKYYEQHKETIMANSAEYRAKYRKDYYEKNKEIIAQKRKLKRLEKKIAEQAAKGEL